MAGIDLDGQNWGDSSFDPINKYVHGFPLADPIPFAESPTFTPAPNPARPPGVQVKFTVKPALGALAGSEIKATGKVVGESNTDFTLDLLRKLKVGHLVDQLAARDDVDCPANEMRLVINGKTINSDPSKT